MNGQTALVTGASSGIGAEYARQYAARGADVILVARREAALQRLATELRERYGRRVDVLVCDLEVPGAAERLARQVADLGREVDILINNAGFATHGAFAGTDSSRLTGQVQLNCVAMVDLTRQFLPGMVARRRGTVVNVASTAAFQPVPHMAVYGATKAFVLSFTEALWAEARPAGVAVVAICPGATETEFFDVVGTTDAQLGRRRTSEQVVAATFRALRRNRPSIVDGRANWLVAQTPRFTPRRLVARITARIMRPRQTRAAVSVG